MRVCMIVEALYHDLMPRTGTRTPLLTMSILVAMNGKQNYTTPAHEIA